MIYVTSPDPTASVASFDDAMLKTQIDNIINLLEFFCETEFAQKVDSRLVVAWRGHECFLAYYGTLHAEELERRQRHSVRAKVRLDILMDYVVSGDYSLEPPPWFTRDKLHKSHQSHLIAHNPRFYASVFPDIPHNLKLVWS